MYVFQEYVSKFRCTVAKLVHPDSDWTYFTNLDSLIDSYRVLFIKVVLDS